MTRAEWKERTQKSKKCLYGINFFGIVLCVRNITGSQDLAFENIKKLPECMLLEECADDVKKREYKKMAKNFATAGSAKIISEVAATSSLKATVVTVKNIENDNLLDYPKNNEEVQDTADLENSIKEIGFTDPIEVTAFGQPDGKYMILSGHRRRAAGVKCGMTAFPCIVKPFDNEQAVHNYVLLANSQRDSAKDPLLFAKRYKMHEAYLNESGFSGKYRDEIAKRMGLSVQQADRYNAMSKVISPVWDMVKDEIVGITSVVPLAPHTEAEQGEIYDIMQEALTDGVTLTRDTVRKIVDGYRDGCRTWKDVKIPRSTGESNIPLNAFMNTDPGETRDKPEYDRNDEVRREFDPIAANADADDAARAAWEEEHANNAVDESKEDEGAQHSKEPLTEDEKALKCGKDISKFTEKLNACLDNIYEFEDEAEAEKVMQNLAKTVVVMVNELHTIGREYNKEDLFGSIIKSLKSDLNEY